MKKQKNFEREGERIEGGGVVSGRKPVDAKKTNYTPYIIGGVILLAVLAAIIFG